jgi:hypothetical protein
MTITMPFRVFEKLLTGVLPDAELKALRAFHLKNTVWKMFLKIEDDSRVYEDSHNRQVVYRSEVKTMPRDGRSISPEEFEKVKEV